MPGKKIPSWPSDKAFDALPTLDQLQQQTGEKRWKLHALLRSVPRWKCTDNTVRYDAVSAAAALAEQWEDDPSDPANDNDDGPANDNARDAPLPADPQQAMLVLCQRATQQAMATMQRTLGLQNDVIKAMGEPLRMGMQLVKESQQVLRGRLGKYDKQWDRMILVTEELQSLQTERETKREREKARTQMLSEGFATAKQYLPDVLAKFQLTREAGMALDLALSVEPEHLEAFIDLGVLPPEKTAMAKQLIEILKARREQQRAKNGEGNDASEPTATAATAAPGEPEAAASAQEVRNDTVPAAANGAAH